MLLQPNLAVVLEGNSQSLKVSVCERRVCGAERALLLGKELPITQLITKNQDSSVPDDSVHID